jgi:hypothetical protein
MLAKKSRDCFDSKEPFIAFPPALTEEEDAAAKTILGQGRTFFGYLCGFAQSVARLSLF